MFVDSVNRNEDLDEEFRDVILSEFDKALNIENIKEEEILNRYPKDSYGYSKNVISRLILNKPTLNTTSRILIATQLY